MMAFFDSLVQRELEGWTSNTDLSDDQEMGIETGPSADDDDTETTRSSAVTSQSDDNDSADGSGNCMGWNSNFFFFFFFFCQTSHLYAVTGQGHVWMLQIEGGKVVLSSKA